MHWSWKCDSCGQRSGRFRRFDRMTNAWGNHIKVYCPRRFRTMPVENLNGSSKKAMKSCDKNCGKKRKLSKIRKTNKYRSWKYDR